MSTHWKSNSAVPSNEDGSTASSGLNPPACLTFALLQIHDILAKKGHHSCVFDHDFLKCTANSTLFNFQLAAWTRCKRQGLEKKIHFIPSPVVQGQPRMEVFRLPSWERQPLLPCSSLQQIKGACCTFFRRKRQGAKKRSGNGRVMGMARTPALGSP